MRRPYPDESILIERSWQFSHVDGEIAALAMQLEPDGTVAGYHHFNEAAWRIENGMLALVTRDGETSTRFDRCDWLAADTVRLTGRFLLDPRHAIDLQLTQNPSLPVLAEDADPIGSVSLDADRILDSTWLMRLGSQPYPRELRFAPDGGLLGSEHPALAGWRIQSGVLLLLDGSGTVSLRIEEARATPDGLCLSGQLGNRRSGDMTLELKEYRRLRSPTLLAPFTTERPAGNSRETLAPWIKSHGWSIGEHSYGTPQVFEPTMARLVIGRFTSIAAGVSIALGNHAMSTGTTYPFSSMPGIWPSAPALADHETRGDVSIGSDVWIGTGVFIASGVTIGHGAILGAHACVARDVPPYAVVVGNPGRVARYRFEPDVIEALLRIAWWDWEDGRIAAVLPILMGGDVRAFIAHCEPDGEERA